MRVWIFSLAIWVALFPCCNGEDEDSKLFEIEGVEVVLEKGKGPERVDMLDAVMRYRNAALERFELEQSAEVVLWGVINEIRWTEDAVPGDAEYDADTLAVLARWLGCTLDVPLYRALVDHYTFQTTGVSDPVPEQRAWAAELQAEVAAELCP